MYHTVLIVPTFKEPRKVAEFSESFAAARNAGIQLLVINGNPGDATTAFLSERRSEQLIEIGGHPRLFWSGLVNLGLQWVLGRATPPEFVIIMNIDVEFDADVLARLIDKARHTPRAQLAAVTVSGENVVSSGVKVRSWTWMLNRHPYAGTRADCLPADELVPVDFLPGRCTLIPFDAIRRASLIAAEQLPHYGGDNEYTNRLRLLGFTPYIFTGCQVRLDARNTGHSVFHQPLPLPARMRRVFSIKSNYNPVYRLRFVRLAYPWYARPTAMLLSLLRSAAEVGLGGRIIKLLHRRAGTGFAGI